MTKAASFRTPDVRRTALKLAETIGVKKAAQELGLHRNTLNNWKRRKNEQGTQGLKPTPRKQTAHPQMTPAATVEAIIDLALAHPSFGCYRLKELLPSDDRQVSTTTIQNILNRKGLGTPRGRLMALEDRGTLDGMSDEQTEFVNRMNPCFPKCNVRNQGPGWALAAGSWRIRVGSSPSDMLLFTVLDVWTGYVFCVVTNDDKKEKALQKLNHQIARFYHGWGCKVQSIYLFEGMEKSDNSSLAYENNHFLFQIYLSQNFIVRNHRSCCLMRFQEIISKEFFKLLDVDTFRSDVDEFDQVLHEWLRYYNAERKHQGYPHRGRAPLHRFNLRPKVRSPRKTSEQQPHGPARGGTTGAENSPSCEPSRGRGRKTNNLLDFIVNDIPEVKIQPSKIHSPPFDFLWYYCNRSRVGPAREFFS